VAINIQISKSCVVRRMEQFGGISVMDQDVRLGRLASSSLACLVIDGLDRLVEGCDATAGLLQLGPQRLEGRRIFFLQRRDPSERLGRKGGAGVRNGPFDKCF
jgi:hypothetical protein